MSSPELLGAARKSWSHHSSNMFYEVLLCTVTDYIISKHIINVYRELFLPVDQTQDLRAWCDNTTSSGTLIHRSVPPILICSHTHTYTHTFSNNSGVSDGKTLDERRPALWATPAATPRRKDYYMRFVRTINAMEHPSATNNVPKTVKCVKKKQSASTKKQHEHSHPTAQIKKRTCFGQRCTQRISTA